MITNVYNVLIAIEISKMIVYVKMDILKKKSKIQHVEFVVFNVFLVKITQQIVYNAKMIQEKMHQNVLVNKVFMKFKNLYVENVKINVWVVMF